MNTLKMTLALMPSLFSLTAFANSVDQAKTIQNLTNQHSIATQSHVNKSVEHSTELASEIDQLSQEIKNLTVYKNHLSQLTQNQQQEMASLHQQIGDIKHTRQGLVPLMYQMLDGLDDIIAESKPIKLHQRQQRLASLRALMKEADVSDAEKYRRILEAYQIELDYGNKLGIYRDDIQLKNGDTREADIFYFGKAVFVARSLDKSRYWTWNSQSRDWESGDNRYLDQVNKAFAIADKSDTPTLLKLPVSITQEDK